MRTRALVLVALAAGLFLVVPSPAAAQSDACTDVLADGTNESAEPGGQLADAIGDQRSAVESELDDRWFDARLANATSDAERARIVAAELDRIESHLATLETCWSAHRAASDGTDDGDRLTENELATLQRRSTALDSRLDETEREASSLPDAVRERHDVDAEAIGQLEERVTALREGVTRVSGNSSTDGV